MTRLIALLIGLLVAVWPASLEAAVSQGCCQTHCCCHKHKSANPGWTTRSCGNDCSQNVSTATFLGIPAARSLSVFEASEDIRAQLASPDGPNALGVALHQRPPPALF